MLTSFASLEPDADLLRLSRTWAPPFLTLCSNSAVQLQRCKNLGSIALLPALPILSKRSGFFWMISNFHDSFKTLRIFPDDCQFSGWFQNCPDFSRWLPIFRIISKLSGFFQMTANFPNYFKTVRIFTDDCQFSGWVQNCSDFPDDCQFAGLFQNCPEFPRWLPIYFPNNFKTVRIFQMTGVGGRGARTFITHSLAMSWEAKVPFLGLSWETDSRTLSGKFLRVESCYPESFGFLCLFGFAGVPTLIFK